MLFLIALVVAVIFAATASKALRKAPLPFYIAAALLSAGAQNLLSYRQIGRGARSSKG